ncbi:MAG: M3 family oligoendopeptidase, partial [Nitrospira sp. SB0666_bin_27]|nr:M3 family oligoendopeptidase [Nitrospira sp. SB0666_bin_27]
AHRVFAERHIDAAPAPGKMGGAFCYSVLPSLTPYVLLNYSGDARDVATLAHELGHAVHSMMARHHSVHTFHATLPLAETASVFGEQLLSNALLADASAAKVKQRLLVSQLDDLYATILRQAYFVEFENQAHQLIAERTTSDRLAQTYLHLLKEQFGRSVAISKAFQWEWLTIPHIFRSPFYCYAYSFGNLLVLSLFQRYKKEGESFIPQYLELLSHGGSRSPQDMLGPLGIDLCQKSFWQAGFNRIKELVESLEKTVSKTV